MDFIEHCNKVFGGIKSRMGLDERGSEKLLRRMLHKSYLSGTKVHSRLGLLDCTNGVCVEAHVKVHRGCFVTDDTGRRRDLAEEQEVFFYLFFIYFFFWFPHFFSSLKIFVTLYSFLFLAERTIPSTLPPTPLSSTAQFGRSTNESAGIALPPEFSLEINLCQGMVLRILQIHISEIPRG